MKWCSRTITSRANVLVVYNELFMDVSVAEEHDFILHDCHSALWPKSLCQSWICINIGCHQCRANAMPIRNQWLVGIPNMSCDVLLVYFFPILNESGYTFDDFWSICHVIGFTMLRLSSGSTHLSFASCRHTNRIPSSRSQFGEVNKILNCISGTLSSCIKNRNYWALIWPTKRSPLFKNKWFDKRFEIEHFFNQIRNDRHIIHINPCTVSWL